MINRKIDSILKKHFENSRNALLLTGVRQIGKTSSIRAFGRAAFKNFVEINFIESPDAAAIFIGASNAQDILLRLSAYTQVPLEKNKTLVFLDEIQACPEAITAIKFLVEEGYFRYILSGSLLGVELKDVRSIPVVFLTVQQMYPLSLEEFYRAVGVQDLVLDSLKDSFRNGREVDPFVHKKMMETFKLYLEEIFNLIPAELNAQNKRFILKNLNENMKFSRYENSFIWLKETGVAIPVYNVDEPKIPLLLSRSRNLFKLFQNDVGLLACQYASGVQLKILSGDEAINYGSIYENVVAQELLYQGYELYYFNNKKLGELDFVIQRGGTVLPLEIKSGKDYKRHNALSNVLRTENYGIEKAMVFCNGNIKNESGICYMPIYMLMFMEQEQQKMGTYKINLDGLS